MTDFYRMSASPVSVSLNRTDLQQAWGFRLQGGRDFRMQLSVKKVMPNSPCYGKIHPGDAILSIGTASAQNLTHMQAHQLIKSSGGKLDLMLQKGQFKELNQNVKPKGPVKFAPWNAK